MPEACRVVIIITGLVAKYRIGSVPRASLYTSVFAMSASPGQFLFGDFWAEDEEDEEGDGGEGARVLLPGKGTIVLQQIQTAQDMIRIIHEKGWPGIEIVDGTPKMKWAAWMTAQDLGLEVTGYEPDEKELRQH